MSDDFELELTGITEITEREYRHLRADDHPSLKILNLYRSAGEALTFYKLDGDRAVYIPTRYVKKE